MLWQINLVAYKQCLQVLTAQLLRSLEPLLHMIERVTSII